MIGHQFIYSQWFIAWRHILMIAKMFKFPEHREVQPYTQEAKLHKDLLIFACAFMNLAVVLWLAIYWIMGLHFSTTVPLVYQLISVSSLVYYLRFRNFEIFRFVQLSLFLFVPFIMQWSIGSSVTASGVMLWALLAPTGHLGDKGGGEQRAREMRDWPGDVCLSGPAGGGAPVRPVARIPVGNGTLGPVTERLQKEFFGLLKGDRDDPYGWLMPVPVPVEAPVQS